MILSNILFELKRIANSLETIAGIKLEKEVKIKAGPVEFFDSTKEPSKEEEEDKIHEEFKKAKKRGLFFEEDALSEDLLRKL